MSKRINWWWVVATHERGNIREDERDALGMIDFLNYHAAARAFISKRSAKAWVNTYKQLNDIPEGIKMQIVSDEAWKLIINIYFYGKNYGKTLLS